MIANARRTLDERQELTGDEQDDVMCCGAVKTPPKPPEKPHFALRKKWHHDTGFYFLYSLLSIAL
jgi:hypothetical protein